MIAMKAVARGLGGLALAVALSVAAPLAAQAASYPPATTGTFAVTAHPGANHVTVNGLGANASATAIVSGSGPAPTLGEFRASATHAETANLVVGTTDAEGAVSFTLVFPADASGVYNASVSTADGHSVSGSITIPSHSSGPLAWTGSNIAMWVVWLAGILVILGLIALLIAAARRRRTRN
ncbi:hypothetical protein [Gryllotalpicola koreensis]|uniref:Copper resistance protein CopC n=1 Tax=Gryllotalpicola koreensis TaxID=993086 RepID=A0ABP8A0F0_9MICO